MVLVWLGLAFILGVFTGAEVSLPAGGAVFAGAVVAITALPAWRRRRVRLGLLVLACLLLGVGRGEASRVHFGPSDLAYYNGQTMRLTGVISAEPDVRDTGINYVVTVDHRLMGSAQIPVTGQLELHAAPSQILEEGDRIQLYGKVAAPISSSAVPYRAILAHRGIYSAMSFPSVFVTGHTSLGLLGFADGIRTWIENRIGHALPEPEATLLLAIIIGARSAQLGSLTPVLIKTGLIHLIAVSGLKIAIVAGTVHGVARRWTYRRPTFILSTVVLLGYWLVSGATVAGLRASIMWLLVFIAAYLGRPTFGPVSLTVAVAAMVGLSPDLLWDSGFQLTVMGTAGIVALGPFLDRITDRLPSFLSASTSTTLAAQMGVLPVQIAGFHVVSPISLLTNAVVLPFIPLTMAVGFVIALLPVPALAAVGYGLTHLLILLAQWAVRVPGAADSVTSVPVALVVAYYAVLLSGGILIYRARFGREATGGARGNQLVFGLSVAVVGLVLSQPAPGAGGSIRFLTTGSALLTCHAQTVLIDGGKKPSRLLTRLDQALPLDDRRVDVVIDTEPASANVAALLAVIRNVRTGEVLDPGLEYTTQTYARWRSELDGSRIPTLALRPGLQVRGKGFVVRVLAPDGVYPNPKDGAGMLLISTRRIRILYVGTASATEQQDLPFTVAARASTAITGVPLDPTLLRAAGIRRVVRAVGGESMAIDC